MTLKTKIDVFLDGGPHAVVGASRNRSKYGNKVLRAYLQDERTAYPVNPSAEEIEGIAAYPDLASTPQPLHGISVITPPAVTEEVVVQAINVGVKHIWMQPGAESAAAIRRAEDAGINTIGGDACLLVVLGFREEAGR